MTAPGSLPAAPAGTATRLTDRLDRWQDIVREHFVALDIDAEQPDEFLGSVTATRVGHLDVATVESTAQVCRRSPALARSDDRVYLQVGLLTRGAAVLSQDGRDAELRPGAWAVYETDRPFVWDLHGDWQLHVFTWARPAIALPPSRSCRLTARAHPTSGGLPGLVGRVLRELGDAPPGVSVPAGLRLADGIGELVTTAAEEAASLAAVTAPPDLLRRIDAWITEHLADPALGPAEVARAHHLSTRHLHRLFARSGTTVAERIRQQRLDRCRRELADPRRAAVPVGEIGRRWGFPDAASFSRAFRRAHGTTPTLYRTAHTGH